MSLDKIHVYKYLKMTHGIEVERLADIGIDPAAAHDPIWVVISELVATGIRCQAFGDGHDVVWVDEFLEELAQKEDM